MKLRHHKQNQGPLRHALTGLALAALAVPAMATPILSGGGEPSLQTGLDGVTQDGDFDLDVNLDQLGNDELWTLDASSMATAVMMFEFAGYANRNVMGIYDPSNPGNLLPIFFGSAATGYSTTLRYIGGDFVSTYWNDSGMLLSPYQLSASFADPVFGFYLSTPEGNTFYSQDELNPNAASDGVTDHMVAFRGTSTDYLDPDGDGTYGLFTASNYIIAWEDLRLTGSDRDYQDMVAMVSSVHPVPEPGSMALFGLGLAVLGFIRLKQERNKPLLLLIKEQEEHKNNKMTSDLLA